MECMGLSFISNSWFHSQVSIFSLFLYFFVCIFDIKYSSYKEDKKNFVWDNVESI